MGFWSTVLTALRFRSGRLPVITEPLSVRRLRLDASVPRLRRDTVTVRRVLSNSNVTHRVRVEVK